MAAFEHREEAGIGFECSPRPRNPMGIAITTALLAGALTGCAGEQSSEGSGAGEELQSRLNLAIARFEQGDSTAVELAREIAEQAPESAAGPSLAGLAAVGAGDLEEALRQHEEAVRRAPDDAAAWFLLGDASQAAGSWEDALAAYQQVLYLRPDELHVHHLLAENLRYRGDTDRAIEHLRAIVVLDPVNAAALLDLGEALVETGRIEEGRAAYGRAAAACADLSDEARHWLDVAAGLGEGPELLRAFRFAGNLQKRGDDYRASRARLERSDLAGPIERIVAAAIPKAVGSGPFLGSALEIRGSAGGGRGPVDATVVAREAGETLVFVTDGELWGIGGESDRPVSLGGPGGAVAVASAELNLDEEPDLCVADREGAVFVRMGLAGEGGLGFAEAGAPVAAGLGAVRSLIPFDYDLDGDLDLVIDRGAVEIALLRNNGDGTFSELASESGLAGATAGAALLVEDLDGDGDSDLILVDGSGIRTGRYVGEGGFRIEPTTLPGGTGAALLDLAGDDARDLVVVDGRGALNIYGGAKLERLGGIDLGLEDGEGDWRLLPWDANADGFCDLLVAAPSGEAVIVLRSAEDEWSVRPAGGLGEGGVLALWMWQSGVSVVALGKEGNCRMHRAARAGSHVSVRLTGIKDNASGIGTKVELRAGRLFAADRIDPAPGSGARRSTALHFALGGRPAADRVKVHWPNGVWEDATQPERWVHIEQDPALLGSCPFLYAWNGERFDFVTDILGNAPLGLALAPGVYFPANPSERIALEKLEPMDGFLELRLTEELRETVYIDDVALLAVDLPGEARAFSSNALRPPPYPTEPFVIVGAMFPPAAASDDRGVDQTEIVRAKDGRFTGSDLAHHAAYQGLAERTHWIELDLGVEPGAKRVALVLRGGYWWSEAGNYAAAQAVDVAVPPRLEVPDAQGGWRTVKSPFGFPGGRPKTVVHEIGDLIEPSDPRVRIVTNFRLHWDQIAIDTTSTALSRRTTRIEPSAATLAFRGYSRAIDDGAPVPYGFDYEQVDRRRPYPRMTGAYTRFGNVLPLLSRADDRLVVMGHGEEIALRFDTASLPPLEAGWSRSFLFHSVGWDKDGDPKTAHGTTVEPLPFGEMSAYPFGEGESWPASDSLVGYVREWNTRFVGTSSGAT